jgi:hypothetical protein
MHIQHLNLKVPGKLTFFILYERAYDFDLRKGRLATALAIIRKRRSGKLHNWRQKPALEPPRLTYDVKVNDLDYQEKPIMMKYEYKVLQFDLKGMITPKVNQSEMEAQLNQHGAEGWELLHVSEILDMNSQTKILLATMKRPLH